MTGFGVLGAEWFNQIVIPFVLVFTLFFAILEKSKILGEGKHQINSIVSLAIALILISVPPARFVILQVVPIIAVLAIVILAFMIILGFVGGIEKEGTLNKGLIAVIGIIAAIAIIVTVLWSTGWLNKVIEMAKKDELGGLWQSLGMITVIVVVMIIALKSGGKKD